MSATARVTVTLPAELVERIDRLASNRSRFISEAIAHELDRRRRDALEASLVNPHPETDELAAAGLGEWMAAAAEGDDDLLDPAAGRPVRWVPGEGWVEEAS